MCKMPDAWTQKGEIIIFIFIFSKWLMDIATSAVHRANGNANSGQHIQYLMHSKCIPNAIFCSPEYSKMDEITEKSQQTLCKRCADTESRIEICIPNWDRTSHRQREMHSQILIYFMFFGDAFAFAQVISFTTNYSMDKWFSCKVTFPETGARIQLSATSTFHLPREMVLF